MLNLLPETYLSGLIVLLVIISILVGRQLIRVRNDEISLIKLDRKNIANSDNVSEMYELAAVQIRKRLYPQAISTLKKAVKLLDKEPPEAIAIIQNALGFSLAAQDDFKSAITHYKIALKAKPNYPVGLNNLAFAKQKLYKYEEALEIYKKVLSIDKGNRTAEKQLRKIELRNLSPSQNKLKDRGF